MCLQSSGQSAAHSYSCYSFICLISWTIPIKGTESSANIINSLETHIPPNRALPCDLKDLPESSHTLHSLQLCNHTSWAQKAQANTILFEQPKTYKKKKKDKSYEARFCILYVSLKIEKRLIQEHFALFSVVTAWPNSIHGSLPAGLGKLRWSTIHGWRHLMWLYF